MLMKKLTSNKGNTLTVTIVIIVVMSILAATAAMMITLSTRVQIRNEKNLKEKIALENSMYEVLTIDLYVLTLFPILSILSNLLSTK